MRRRVGTGWDGVSRQQALQLVNCGQDRPIISFRKPESSCAKSVDLFFYAPDHTLSLGFDVESDGRHHSKSLGSGLDYRSTVIDQGDIGT